jgi:hypothetical protein
VPPFLLPWGTITRPPRIAQDQRRAGAEIRVPARSCARPQDPRIDALEIHSELKPNAAPGFGPIGDLRNPELERCGPPAAAQSEEVRSAKGGLDDVRKAECQPVIAATPDADGDRGWGPAFAEPAMATETAKSLAKVIAIFMLRAPASARC